MFFNRIALAAASTAISLGPVSVAAQPGPPPSMPSYARPSNEQTVKGRIASIDGKYDVTVRDDRGYLDRIRLHDGTIINPTGLTLAPGMSVTILGYNSGNRFDANEIDTPYVAYEPLYYPVPYWGPYWGWGPAYSFGLGFGGPGWGFRGGWWR
jgi:hypothetical protein